MPNYTAAVMERIINDYICDEGKPWFNAQPSYEAAWAACPHPWWLIEFLGRLGFNDTRTLREFACRCIRETPFGRSAKAIDLLTDPIGRVALEAAERYIASNCTREELEAASQAAKAKAEKLSDSSPGRFMIVAAAEAASPVAMSAARYTPKNIHRAIRKATGDNMDALDIAGTAQTGFLREYVTFADVLALIRRKADTVRDSPASH